MLKIMMQYSKPTQQLYPVESPTSQHLANRLCSNPQILANGIMPSSPFNPSQEESHTSNLMNLDHQPNTNWHYNQRY